MYTGPATSVEAVAKQGNVMRKVQDNDDNSKVKNSSHGNGSSSGSSEIKPITTTTAKMEKFVNTIIDPFEAELAGL